MVSGEELKSQLSITLGCLANITRDRRQEWRHRQRNWQQLKVILIRITIAGSFSGTHCPELPSQCPDTLMPCLLHPGIWIPILLHSLLPILHHDSPNLIQFLYHKYYIKIQNPHFVFLPLSVFKAVTLLIFPEKQVLNSSIYFIPTV